MFSFKAMLTSITFENIKFRMDSLFTKVIKQINISHELFNLFEGF